MGVAAFHNGSHRSFWTRFQLQYQQALSGHLQVQVNLIRLKHWVQIAHHILSGHRRFVCYLRLASLNKTSLLSGVLTSDPRIVEKALPVPLLTYEEATELAFFGAQVLHPQAMQPALQSRQLAVRVKNSYNRQVSPHWRQPL